ncbi:MAG: PadR family transcriptional regulator [Candidatus Methanoperedens sp.]|nr:PadR family transcriptional regulator [Candidatus Methanoperedens sp.]
MAIRENKKQSKLRMYAFFVLYFLNERSSLSGYELGNLIKEKTHGYFSATAGNVYSVLKDLENKGYISSEEPVGGREKVQYNITLDGKKALRESALQYKERFEHIMQFFDKVINEVNI